jgi:hypothetical protein
MDFHYTVEGSWPFPLDMLRRDGAVAASPQDQATIDHLSAPYAPDRDAIRTRRSVGLVLRDAERRRPYTARWRSFGWDVPGDAEYRAGESDRAERRKMEALRASALAKLTDEERAALAWFAERGS